MEKQTKFDLSKKTGGQDCQDWFYYEKDVKEFIRLLKKRLREKGQVIFSDNTPSDIHLEDKEFEEIINKLAGEKLIW